MRILVLGAAESVGRHMVAGALQPGHEVNAVVRDPDHARRSPENASAAVGNAAEPRNVARLSADQDVAVSATRPKLGSKQEHPSTAENLLKCLRLTGTRLILVGGAGKVKVPDGDALILDHHGL
ncbi:NAD(P)-dependent oxidoreductase [uncultured Nitratireductor sp.]|uniref:NAD(P)-dependent oxidoreductase n=1 Tax=uncultured Nitratireductor sp. TaxID=520953 RepID=UPI0026007DBD|nr:NAD(P)H-binding protein [uncultured Nitratireductor sp.]